jgi:hypothetical protein
VSVCHVLGVLEDDERRLRGVLERSVALADAERARLTLAKTTDPGRLLRWFAPSALQSMCVSLGDIDVERSASHLLARAVESVPATTPVTTRLLGRNTSSALVELLRSGPYDALVATDALLGHHRKLRRELRGLGVAAVPIDGRPTLPATVSSRTAPRLRSGAHA